MLMMPFALGQVGAAHLPLLYALCAFVGVGLYLASLRRSQCCSDPDACSDPCEAAGDVTAPLRPDWGKALVNLAISIVLALAAPIAARVWGGEKLSEFANERVIQGALLVVLPALAGYVRQIFDKAFYWGKAKIPVPKSANRRK